MKPDWRAVLGIAITVFLLWFVFRGVSWAEVRVGIQGADLRLFLLAVAIVTGTFFLRALRWKILLHPVCPDTGLYSRFAAVNIGFMVNNLLPARAGEFARALALARMEPVTASGAVGSLVVERFLDGLAIFALVFVAMALPGFPDDPVVGTASLGAWIQGATVLLGLLLVFMVVMLLFPRALLRILGGVATVLPGKLPRLLVGALESFLDGLRVLQNPGLLALAVLWSLGVWAWHSMGFWLALRAFGFEVGYDAALFVNATVAFAVGIPAAPGFFGTFHAGAAAGLAVYGISKAGALPFALGFHLGGFVPVTVIGLYFAWKLGFTLKDMEKSETQVERAMEEDHPGPPASEGSPAVGRGGGP